MGRQKPLDDEFSSPRKKTKICAQRKFAQYTNNGNSKSRTVSNNTNGKKATKPVAPVTPPKLPPLSELSINPSDAIMPHTEDFITFLCYRGTEYLPTKFNMFNFPQSVLEEHVKNSQSEDDWKKIEEKKLLFSMPPPSAPAPKSRKQSTTTITKTLHSTSACSKVISSLPSVAAKTLSTPPFNNKISYPSSSVSQASSSSKCNTGEDDKISTSNAMLKEKPIKHKHKGVTDEVLPVRNIFLEEEIRIKASIHEGRTLRSHKKCKLSNDVSIQNTTCKQDTIESAKTTSSSNFDSETNKNSQKEDDELSECLDEIMDEEGSVKKFLSDEKESTDLLKIDIDDGKSLLNSSRLGKDDINQNDDSLAEEMVLLSEKNESDNDDVNDTDVVERDLNASPLPNLLTSVTSALPMSTEESGGNKNDDHSDTVKLPLLESTAVENIELPESVVQQSQIEAAEKEEKEEIEADFIKDAAVEEKDFAENLSENEEVLAGVDKNECEPETTTTTSTPTFVLGIGKVGNKKKSHVLEKAYSNNSPICMEKVRKSYLSEKIQPSRDNTSKSEKISLSDCSKIDKIKNFNTSDKLLTSAADSNKIKKLISDKIRLSPNEKSQAEGNGSDFTRILLDSKMRKFSLIPKSSCKSPENSVPLDSANNNKKTNLSTRKSTVTESSTSAVNRQNDELSNLLTIIGEEIRKKQLVGLEEELVKFVEDLKGKKRIAGHDLSSRSYSPSVSTKKRKLESLSDVAAQINEKTSSDDSGEIEDRLEAESKASVSSYVDNEENISKKIMSKCGPSSSDVEMFVNETSSNNSEKDDVPLSKKTSDSAGDESDASKRQQSAEVSRRQCSSVSKPIVKSNNGNNTIANCEDHDEDIRADVDGNSDNISSQQFSKKHSSTAHCQVKSNLSAANGANDSDSAAKKLNSSKIVSTRKPKNLDNESRTSSSNNEKIDSLTRRTGTNVKDTNESSMSEDIDDSSSSVKANTSSSKTENRCQSEKSELQRTNKTNDSENRSSARQTETKKVTEKKKTVNVKTLTMKTRSNRILSPKAKLMMEQMMSRKQRGRPRKLLYRKDTIESTSKSITQRDVNTMHEQATAENSLATAPPASARSRSNQRLYYIPITASTSGNIQGVTVKLGSEGRNNKVIMSATLVTQTPETCTSSEPSSSTTLPASFSANSERRRSSYPTRSREPSVSSSNNKEEPKTTKRPKIIDAPTFYPTEKEFLDPLQYIESIRTVAENYGICRIVPPSTFKPECKVADEMRFMAYNQYVHKMLNRWGNNVKEMTVIKKYLATQNITLGHPPWVGGIELDLPRLYGTVQQCGGLKEVIEKEKWQYVADLMKIPKLAQDRASKLDDIYCKYLLPYDTLTEGERSKLFEQVEKDWRNYSKHKQSQNKIFENMIDCVTKGRNMPLSSFYRIARNTMMMWFGNETNVSKEIVEEEFWKHVSTGKYHVCVNFGSIDSGTHGYGFPISKNSTLSKHPWNLKVLANNPSSVLRSLGPIIGVTVPTLSVGMLFSTCCWYRDPHGLPWIEYLHHGASKIWYGISGEHNEIFRNAAFDITSQYRKDKKIWLSSNTLMIPPPLLLEHDVPLTRVIQDPGQFIVVFPKSFTSNISTGYVVSESVYFAHPSWLSIAEEMFRDMHESCEPSVFSFEELLVSIADDFRANITILKQVLPMLSDMRDKEVALRSQLEELGLRSSERLVINKKKKYSVSSFDGDSYECTTCRANLYISFVINSNNQSNYCLQHAVQFLYKKQNQSKNCKLMYTYTEEELENLIIKVKERIQLKSTKKTLNSKQ